MIQALPEDGVGNMQRRDVLMPNLLFIRESWGNAAAGLRGE